MAEVTGEHSGIKIETHESPNVGEELLKAVPGAGAAVGIFESATAAGEDGNFSAGEVAGLAGEAAGFVTSCMEVASIAADPIGWLIGQGLDFLISVCQPLEDLIHMVSGDGPALDTASGNFGSIGEGLQSYAEEFAADAKESLATWDGDAAEAAAKKLGEFAAGINGIAAKAGDIAELLKISSMIMTVIEEFIKALLTEFISWLIMIWIPALAAAVPTFGGSTAAAGTATGVKAVSTGAKATKQVSKLQKLLNVIKDLIAKLKDVFGKLKTKFMKSGAMDKFRSADGALGSRLEKGFTGAMKEAAVDAGKDAIGLGDTQLETGLGVTEKAGEMGKNLEEAFDRGSIGEDGTTGVIRDKLDF